MWDVTAFVIARFAMLARTGAAAGGTGLALAMQGNLIQLTGPAFLAPAPADHPGIIVAAAINAQASP